MFVPLGFMIPLLFKKCKRWYITYLIGFGATLFIEILQLISKRGIFELDDIINNTLGCIIGYGIVIFFISIYEKRYKVLFDVKLEDIKSYNKKFKKNKLSNILFVIEEFVAVYKDKTIQSMLQTALSQWRSVGIYILITTQRPSSKVITGDLKCNLGIILGLKTLDSNNSNVVIDKYNLLNNLRGNGHGYIRYNGKLEEFQSFYIDHTEVKKRIRNIERKKEKIEEAPKTDAKVVVLKKEGLKEETTNNNSIGEVESLDFLDSL